MNSANDFFKDYNCTDNYYKYYLGMVYTDGVKALCTRFECYWFLDLIAFGQLKIKGNFQVWTLKRTGFTATVTCDDGNGNILRKENIPYTDFKPLTATIWVEDNVILLPSEH